MKFLRAIIFSALLIPSLILTADCTDQSASTTPESTSPTEPTEDVIEVATEDGRFTSFLSALQAANLTEVYKEEGPFTVFAPTDEAFGQIPADTLNNLLNDIPTLSAVLTYHIVSGKIMAADLANLPLDDRGCYSNLFTSVSESGLMINDARIVGADIEASNGVIHAIDRVLINRP
jgi:uncharacterized surface protein with fasciclin (FAS1) repeats